MFKFKIYKKLFVLILFFSSFLFGCSIHVPLPPFDVYICGNEGNVVKWWKNGVEQPVLTSGGTQASAKSIFVDNGNVYICGFEYVGSYQVGKWWINGVAQPDLSDGTKHCMPHSIFVYNGDVYICGYEDKGLGVGEYNMAKWWINGVEQPALTDGSNYACAFSIKVIDGNVYICGYERNASGKDVAKWWINGVEQPALTDGNYNAYARSIFVSQGVVYICGDDDGSATWWKNGVLQMTHGSYAKAFSIFVINGDAYISGYDRSPGPGFTPTWWLNSDEQSAFSPPAPSSNPAGAYSIFCANGKVYMCGRYQNYVRWWIDGVQQPDLTNGATSSTANSIFVVPSI